MVGLNLVQFTSHGVLTGVKSVVGVYASCPMGAKTGRLAFKSQEYRKGRGVQVIT